MRKGISHKKLSRTSNERRQLIRKLIASVVARGYVDTTLAKAKFLQPTLEKMVTKAKAGDLNSLRQIVADTGNFVTGKTLVEYGKLFKSRKGGYTRIIKLGNRIGDNSPYVRLEWVEKLAVVAKPVKIEKPKTTEKKEINKKLTNKSDKTIKK